MSCWHKVLITMPYASTHQLPVAFGSLSRLNKPRETTSSASGIEPWLYVLRPQEFATSMIRHRSFIVPQDSVHHIGQESSGILLLVSSLAW